MLTLVLPSAPIRHRSASTCSALDRLNIKMMLAAVENRNFQFHPPVDALVSVPPLWMWTSLWTRIILTKTSFFIYLGYFCTTFITFSSDGARRPTHTPRNDCGTPAPDQQPKNLSRRGRSIVLSCLSDRQYCTMIDGHIHYSRCSRMYFWIWSTLFMTDNDNEMTYDTSIRCFTCSLISPREYTDGFG